MRTRKREGKIDGETPDNVARRKPVFRLYVAGATLGATRAIVNVKRLLEDVYKGNYELGVIDIYQEREKLEGMDIPAVPMLVREQPLPFLRVVGHFNDAVEIRGMFSAMNQRGSAGEQNGKRNTE